MEEQDPASPTSWLWREIERRFGKEAADELHRDHNEQIQRHARRRALDDYRSQLPRLEQRLAQARRDGKPTAAIEKRIQFRQECLGLREGENDGESKTRSV